jgi:hypothetical protein
MPDLADHGSPLSYCDALQSEIDAYRRTRRPLHLAHAARLLEELQANLSGTGRNPPGKESGQ